MNQQIDGIQTALLDIFARSAQEDSPTSTIADTMAQEKLA